MFFPGYSGFLHNRIEYVDDNNDTLNIWYNLFNEILNKHAPIVTRRVKRNLYNNLNGIIQKFSMQDKWEINIKKAWKLDTENDLKVIRVRRSTLCDKVVQWLATGWCFSPGTPVSSTKKTDLHDITEILLKVALNTTKSTNQPYDHDHGNPWQFFFNYLCNYIFVQCLSPLKLRVRTPFRRGVTDSQN
jgi:hypothetical protein